MGISNCSGPCELCVNNGHCLAGRGDDDFKLDEEKFNSIMENWWNTYVAVPLRRGLRLDQEADESKEEKNMPEEEKNVNKWSACVVSDGTWKVNESIHSGDQIYRIFNDKFDLKANMTINYLGGYGTAIGLHLIDANASIISIEIDEKLRVCLTSSENDSGTLIMKQNLSFNKELRPGCLYRIVDSSLNFKYLMYIRRFSEGYECIDVDIIRMVFSEESKCTKIKTENYWCSSLDLKDMLFKRIPICEGCTFTLE